MKIFGFDSLDWRQINIAWDTVNEDVIKAGTPMDEYGRICNDAGVYGIMMDDIHRNKNPQGRVMVSGCIDFAAAEKRSGVKMTAEAKAALPNVWSHLGGGGGGGGGGGASVQTDWDQTDEAAADFLKNKPFGYFPTGGDTLTWDGNTEGLEGFQDILYKVSDATPTIEDFANGFSVTIMSVTMEFTADCAQLDSGTISLVEPDGLLPYAVIASVDAAANAGISPGTYLLSFDMSAFGGVGMLVSEQLTIPGYTGFAYNKKIEEKYLSTNSSVILHTDADNYLYEGMDVSDTTKILTLAQLKEYVIRGRVMYVYLDHWIFPGTAYSLEGTWGIMDTPKGRYYTAEYTPETT